MASSASPPPTEKYCGKEAYTTPKEEIIYSMAKIITVP